MSIALIAISLMLSNPRKRLKIFLFAQSSGILAITLTYFIMECNEMLSLYLYSTYLAVSTLMIFGMLRYYDRIMIRKLGAKPAVSVLNWTQEFVDMLTSAKLYYFDSAIPRAFASGRSIFISIGLLEMLDDDELKAVLAHEAWHIRHNSGMPFMKQLALMAFSSSTDPELECMADRFAAKIAGSEALSSARDKVDKVFI
ncbi:MAG: M48 family metalloprotease [Candidatus Methanoperedens sp.]|nr:M48 family metalloprotease [Candidatus Methanoperedens sp.]